MIVDPEVIAGNNEHLQNLSIIAVSAAVGEFVLYEMFTIKKLYHFGWGPE